MERPALLIRKARVARRSGSPAARPVARMPGSRRRAALFTRLMLAPLVLSLAILTPAPSAYAAGSGPLTCTGTENVTMVLKGEHVCMTARGIRTPGRMTTSMMRGVFRTHSETRMEFLRLIE